MVSLRPVQPAPSVEYNAWRPSAWAMVLIGALLGGLLVGVVATTFVLQGPLGKYEYHLWRWEANTLLNNVFARAGIGPEPDNAEGEQAVRQYFRMTSQLRAALNSPQPDTTLVDALANERTAYENDVERLVEGYVDEAVTSAGLQRGLPLFSGATLTWPPVDFELTSPPRLLVRSPRDRIERAGDTLLKNDLSLRDIEKIEDDTTDKDTVSIVVNIGGIAAYPAIVRDDRSYDSLLDTASHEWVHHYLAFYPLGEKWGDGGDSEALNETTANIAGREIANLIRKAHPLQLPPGEDGSAPAGQAPTVDFSAEMRALRQQVDQLLADGKVDEAEKAMEDKRQYLAQHGINIRKINQAYFAFYGTYADTPQSSNPIGPKIERVWELTGNVGAFLNLMREVENAQELDQLLAALGG
ncbi:MAG TPA: hypothetical protein VFY90_11775 [Tepidiformaceae bacterium]|nr:hypothetical protein [Tepidiformaceae bacterium]